MNTGVAAAGNRAWEDVEAGMRIQFVVMAGLAVLVAVGAGWYIRDQQVAEQLERDLERRYDVRIVTDGIDLPGRRGNAAYQSVPWFNRLPALRALDVDLRRYRPAFLARHVQTIYVFRTLTIDGESYGGTYDPERRAVYIAASWLGDDDQNPDAMGFHHELSSLLIHGHPEVFSVSRWRGLNPAEFTYRFEQSTSRNLATGRLGLSGSERTYQRGFLCEYGTLSAEDDINTFAQYLIAKPLRLRALETRFPRVGAKAAFLRRALEEIGPWRAAGG